MGWFTKRAPALPVDEQQKAALDERWEWIVETFGKDALCRKEVLLPTPKCFPVSYDGSWQSAIDTLSIIAGNMDIDPAGVHLELYQESGNAISSSNGSRGSTIFLETSGRTGGLYWGRNDEDGLFHIGIERKNLADPEGMVAVLAHELAHIKLLGEELIEENDEPLTDLITVAFGLGVFNANACFRIFSNSASWGYNRLGYLSQMEWGYALARYAVMRAEVDPPWLKHLTPSVRNDLINSSYFM